ncbi:peptide-methionine (R)-S-oxide reductase MsrB [Rhodocyclus tenuis]|uniref:peptide-methionine (R)-S-oxide reductase n=1 Tax=Rhodocyclus gracilis TaxID=2929842 RepID=A0ABX0WID0_9RHOO|nr:peptide-methionine (R)-S-oxide reductase MsrB [Rhodocyclus gracilis]MRD72444.1 peptide-methionine (R)-S-oxide reductase MsrB [Rhodocyclus gracilis]NJA89470.1 peptide-methionine (R)-S-oxide reductase MsrB [Rhodocyclus gracilis]
MGAGIWKSLWQGILGGGTATTRSIVEGESGSGGACGAGGTGAASAESRVAWKRLLPPDSFRVLFDEGTEPPHSHPLNREKGDGTFVCAACHQPLFDSRQKYDSGTGWPSFHGALPDALGFKRDYLLVVPRTEYHCVACGGHQGHVFTDGPPPSGKRYCNNGLALKFIPRGEALPSRRDAGAH